MRNLFYNAPLENVNKSKKVSENLIRIERTQIIYKKGRDLSVSEPSSVSALSVLNMDFGPKVNSRRVVSPFVQEIWVAKFEFFDFWQNLT